MLATMLLLTRDLDTKANRGSVQSGDERRDPKNLLKFHHLQYHQLSPSSSCLKVALRVHFVPPILFLSFQVHAGKSPLAAVIMTQLHDYF